MIKLATQLFLLPVRTVFSGVETMVRGLRAVQIAIRSLGTEADGSRPSPIPPPSAVGRQATTGSGVDTSLQRATEGAVYRGVENNRVEEVREMSGYNCNCGQSPCCCGLTPGPCNPVAVDQDLSGDCCVKVVLYCIVSTRQTVRDDDRVCVPPNTIAFSDNMTNDGFVSWVVAKHASELKDHDSKYLQVTYLVLGRYNVASSDLREEQVAVLGSIAHSLKEGSKSLPGPKK